ncbi:ATP-binding cassette domain-containing protein [Halioxenophilus sp. WMMB6]|uniref:ATP-binding cassette domain-containing protein n=1 Tax=Halioxenophilus sp. WMMB6 TaxID=3073815 RepID=UPI00295E9A18|nr:ATP-binding cassette domain-containing protein [Halioxenophilus sp. WMMB6]
MSSQSMNRANSNEIALAIEGVGFAYPQKVALAELSLELPSGQFLALLGPNGAGKSTLMALLTGLLKPGGGRITVFGRDLARHPRHALAELGVVFQQSTLDLDLSVAQNLSYHCALRGLSPKAGRRAIDQQLERFALSECRTQPVRRLNGGHRRRVELARALLHGPRLLLLDEPSVGLDIPSRRELNRHVRELCRDEGVAVLWATHLLDELQADDQLLVLHRGRCQAQGKVAELVQGSAAGSLNSLFDQLTEAA